MSRIENVSRRQFLHGVATDRRLRPCRESPALVPARRSSRRSGPQAESAPLNPSVYLGIRPDGTVFIVTHRSEMGTGIRTTLPQVAADELDADWSRVTIEQGIGDTRYGDQNTDGSRSIRDFYEAFRHAGAAARAMLVTAAAAQWSVLERRVHHAEPPGRAPADRPHARLRRAGAGRRQVVGAERRIAPASRTARRGSSSARTRPPTTRRTSSPARRSSGSTCSARAWSTPRSSTRRCSAAPCGASTTRRRRRCAACSRRSRWTRSSRRT